MKRTTKPNIAKIFAEGDAIDAAVNYAVRTAVEEHRLAGRPLSEWRDGRVVLVPATKFPKTTGKNGMRNKRSR